MALHIKKAVRVLGAKPEIALAAHVCDGVYGDHGIKECWITSCTDSTHGTQSRHYLGLAIDLRVHNIPPQQRGDIFNELKKRLTDEFVVLWEYRGEPREHYHIHYKGKVVPSA